MDFGFQVMQELPSWRSPGCQSGPGAAFPALLRKTGELDPEGSRPLTSVPLCRTRFRSAPSCCPAEAGFLPMSWVPEPWGRLSFGATIAGESLANLPSLPMEREQLQTFLKQPPEPTWG